MTPREKERVPQVEIFTSNNLGDLQRMMNEWLRREVTEGRIAPEVRIEWQGTSKHAGLRPWFNALVTYYALE